MLLSAGIETSLRWIYYPAALLQSQCSAGFITLRTYATLRNFTKRRIFDTMRQGVKQNIKDNKSYYLTMTVGHWVDLFSRKAQRDLFISSLRYCIKNKGLNVYAYCVMSNHVHLIVNCNEPFVLKDTIRDLKKYTAKAAIQEMINGDESRRLWMLEIFNREGKKDPKNKTYKVWQKGNHAIELYSEKFTWIKINYIHQNPVEAGFVRYPDQWLYSSACNYAEKEDLILKEVTCIPQPLTTG
jgi:REP element-mobilizing transposase RayT